MDNTIIRAMGVVHPLELMVTSEGSGISGLSPTLEIRKPSDGTYFDFSAVAAPYWVSSGGAQTMVLPEVSYLPGMYRYEFDSSVPDYGIVTGTELMFIAKNGGGYPLVLVESVIFEDPMGAMLRFIYKMEKGRWKLDAATNTMTFYDEDDVTPLKVFDMKNAAGMPSVFEIFERMPRP